MITYVHIIHVYTETNRPPSVNEEQPDLINLEADDNSEEKSSTYIQAYITTHNLCMIDCME